MPLPFILFSLLLLSVHMNAHAGDQKHTTSEQEDRHEHAGHSDSLLFLLQHKIAIQKLQQGFPNQTRTQQQANLEKQQHHFQKVWPILQQYLNIPESRYPNNEMYHQSLVSRGSLLAEFGQLFQQFAQLKPSH